MRTCTSAAPRFEEHRDELLHRVAADDRVVDDHDALARDLVERVELQPDPLPAQLLVGLDERAPDVAVLDQALLVRECRTPSRSRSRPACPSPESASRDRRPRVLPRRASVPCARGSRGSRCRRAASRAGRNRRARRCNAHRDPAASPARCGFLRRRARATSPGRTSRSTTAPIRSSAQLSDATTQSSPIRPSVSGRMPWGSRKVTSVRSTSATTE